MHRNTFAQIDLNAIRDNYALACKVAGTDKAVAVIKANAYGHGLLPVAAALSDTAAMLAVATVDEALQLRKGGITKDILVLEGVHSDDAASAAKAANLELVINAASQVDFASGATVWLKIDTGMHRLGIDPSQTGTMLERLRENQATVRALCTHLACADDLEGDATPRQLQRFAEVTESHGLPRSIANSAGILAWPDSHADWIRPGIMLYGSSPFAAEVEQADGLVPAMTLASEIIAIREIPAGDSVGYGARWTASRPSKIATIAAGYADGYPRHAPDGTPVWVGSGTATVAGTVSMDMITVDVTDHPQVEVGDAVELWGRNVSVNDVAARAGTISYDLLTGVSSRVPRVYSDRA